MIIETPYLCEFNLQPGDGRIRMVLDNSKHESLEILHLEDFESITIQDHNLHIWTIKPDKIHGLVISKEED